jgi:hypothetical protein
MPNKPISINRAPVLTLWATVVAERLGYKEDEALSLGKSLTGITAQRKGRRLGIIKPSEHKTSESKKKQADEIVLIELLGSALPATRTDDGIRAVKDGKAITAESARRYLESKFGDSLDVAKSAMVALAKAFPPKELAKKAFHLYEQFRPEIPEGVKGWGAQGVLDLGLIAKLAKNDKD